MALRTRHNHRNASMARAAGPPLIRAILCAALRADSTQRRKREVSNCSSALYALHDFDASAHDDASLHVPSEARVPLDRQFGRVRGWHWRQADATRYRFLLLEVTVPMYGGRREVLAATEATASERSGDTHPGSREREGGHSGISEIFNGHFVTSVSSL